MGFSLLGGPQPGGCSLSCLPSPDELGRKKHPFLVTHLVLHCWCATSCWALGLVLTSPHGRALPDGWVGSYCYSLQNYGCGVLLPPEMHPRDTFWDPEVQPWTPHFSEFAASLTDGKHQKKWWFCNYIPRKPCISIQRVHKTQAEHKGHLCPHGGGTWTSFKKRGLTLLSTPDATQYQHWCVSQHVTFHHGLLNLFWPFFLFLSPSCIDLNQCRLMKPVGM